MKAVSSITARDTWGCTSVPPALLSPANPRRSFPWRGVICCLVANTSVSTPQALLFCYGILKRAAFNSIYPVNKVPTSSYHLPSVYVTRQAGWPAGIDTCTDIYTDSDNGENVAVLLPTLHMGYLARACCSPPLGACSGNANRTCPRFHD